MSLSPEVPGFEDHTGKLRVDVMIENEGTRYRLTMSGQIENDNSRDLTISLASLLELPVPPRELVIDMGGVSYVSSSGIGAFVGTLVDCNKREIALELRNVHDRVKGVFELLGFSSFFRFT